MARFHVFSLRRVRARTALILKVFLLLVLLGLVLPRALAFVSHQILPSLAPLWGGTTAATSPTTSAPAPSTATPSASGTAPSAAIPSTGMVTPAPAATTSLASPATVTGQNPARTGVAAGPADKHRPFLTRWFRNFVAALQAFYQGAN